MCFILVLSAPPTDPATQDYPLCHHGVRFCAFHNCDSVWGTFRARFYHFSAHDVCQAIRAFRHPEQYGPRGIDPTNPDEYPQSRAKGLARAVLDTFPIVKFSRPEDEVRPTKDVETRGVELTNWEVVDTPRPSGDSDGSRWKATGENLPPRKSSQETRAESSADGQLQRTVLKRSGTQASRQNPDVTPQTIGRETCPICIVDFEEGDDLRVLPCEGKHRFHQTCVDPWLLELSSSCPLCREGM